MMVMKKQSSMEAGTGKDVLSNVVYRRLKEKYKTPNLSTSRTQLSERLSFFIKLIIIILFFALLIVIPFKLLLQIRIISITIIFLVAFIVVYDKITMDFEPI